MDPMDPARYVCLTKLGSVATANLMAARLQAEGIDVRVHSAALGPWPVTVGNMAETELWVLSDRVAEASQILMDAEINEVLERTRPRSMGKPVPFRLVALAIGVVFGVLWVLRIIRLWG